jgi:hypothetical protein
MSSGGRRFRRAYAVRQAMVKTGNGCNVTQNITAAKQQRAVLQNGNVPEGGWIVIAGSKQ